MARVDLRFCVHAGFGTGCIFAERATDSGPAVDVWFVDSGTTRTILAESVTETTMPELTKEQRRALRHTLTEYRQTHKRRVRQTADKPRMRRAFSDRPTWRTEWTWAGDEDSLAPAEGPSAAE